MSGLQIFALALAVVVILGAAVGWWMHRRRSGRIILADVQRRPTHGGGA